MAWSYEENFNSLTTGDLNGQDGWSGATLFDVQTSVVYEGAKGVGATNAGSQQTMSRTISEAGGVFYFAMRATETTVYSSPMQLRNGAGTSYLGILLETDGQIVLQTPIGGGNIIAYNADQWYVAEITFDCSAKTASARVHNGSSWSSPVTGTLANTDTFTIWRWYINATTAYLDTITATDPVVVSSFVPKIMMF